MIISKSGPDGNAFAIIGATVRILKEFGLEKVEVDEVMEKMQAGDYDELCRIAEEETEGMISFTE